jgi:outer membrane protein assembly factor BamB
VKSQTKLALLALSLPLAAASMFRGNASHTGVYDSPASPISSVMWKYDTGGRVFSSPAVSGDLVFAGSADHGLHAVSRLTGARKWRFQTQGAVNSSPAVADGLVYFSSLDGFVYAVHVDSGKAAWKFQTGGETRFVAKGIHGSVPGTETMPDPWDFFLSSPVVEDGVVYIGSGDGHIYALDARTGALRWKFKTGNVVHSSPAVSGGIVYAGGWDTYLYALKASDGSVVWKFKTGDDRQYSNQTGIQGSAAVAGGKVFFGCRDANFYALNASNGAELWRYNNKGSWVVGSPAIWNEVVYFATSDSTKFHALDEKTGKPLFSLETGTYTFSSPSIASGFAYFGTFDGRLRAVNLKAKAYSGDFQTAARRENGPKYLTPSGGWNTNALYTDNTLDAMVVGISRMFSLGTFLSSPVMDRGVLYVGSADGYVYALR